MESLPSKTIRWYVWHREAGDRTNFESTARHGLKKFSFLESSFFVSLSDYKSIKKESIL